MTDRDHDTKLDRLHGTTAVEDHTTHFRTTQQSKPTLFLSLSTLTKHPGLRPQRESPNLSLQRLCGWLAVSWHSDRSTIMTVEGYTREGMSEGPFSVCVWRRGSTHPDAESLGSAVLARAGTDDFEAVLCGGPALEHRSTATTLEAVDGACRPDAFFTRVRLTLPTTTATPAVAVCDRDALGGVSLLCCTADDWLLLTTGALPPPLATAPGVRTTEPSPRSPTTCTLAPAPAHTPPTVAPAPPDPAHALAAWLGGGRPAALVAPPAADAPPVPAAALVADGDVARLLAVLEAAVRAQLARPPVARRVAAHRAVRVLFSGGLDSAVVAAVLARTLPPAVTVHLVNVAFEHGTDTGTAGTTSVEAAPDRVAARATLADLQRAWPQRAWRLHAVDVSRAAAAAALPHVLALLRPADTHMDAAIGLALWFAARHNVLAPHDEQGKELQEQEQEAEGGEQIGQEMQGTQELAPMGQSPPPLFLGQGADEQFAGYMRFRHDYRERGWAGLDAALTADLERLWARNLGRDARVLGACGTPPACVCCPFLEAAVCAHVAHVALWRVADLRLPAGTGDKRLLRTLAAQLGLAHAAPLAKHAIQFGTRVARVLTDGQACSRREARSCGATKFPAPPVHESQQSGFVPLSPFS